MISSGARPGCSQFGRSVLLTFLMLAPLRAQAQSGSPTSCPANETWAGRRIAGYRDLGTYFVSGEHGQPELIRPEGLGVNIVAVAQRLEGDRICIKANGAGDMPAGWVNKKNAILLDDAIPYFTSLIERNPKDWDALLRRAESEHALNQREVAIADYTRAVELHPDERFLFLRRGRAFQTMKARPQAASDFERAASLKPIWAELYNQAAGVYVDCPDPAYRNPKRLSR
jgi:tetratricopeptide (TPR) repeat protein